MENQPPDQHRAGGGRRRPSRRLLPPPTPRQRAGRVCLLLAPVIFITHILEHVGVFRVMSPGLEDILIGYPTAFILAILGARLVARTPR